MSQASRNYDPEEPSQVSLHERAADNLSFIRDAMTRASAFTAVPGRGAIVMGLVALVGGYVATLHLGGFWWINTWCLVACVAAGIGIAAILLKARRTHTTLLSGPGRRMVGNFMPPIVTGALLTLLFHYLHLHAWLPGMWLLLYGTAVVCGGAFSVRIVPVMGFCFMALGALTFYATHTWPHVLFAKVHVYDLGMALGFGGFHILFGLIIARRHGG
jgi:hypothetical protein